MLVLLLLLLFLLLLLLFFFLLLFLLFLVFLLLRASLRRTAGELTMLDFVFVLLVAVGAENAMLGAQSSVAAAFVLVATLIAVPQPAAAGA